MAVLFEQRQAQPLSWSHSIPSQLSIQSFQAQSGPNCAYEEAAKSAAATANDLILTVEGLMDTVLGLMEMTFWKWDGEGTIRIHNRADKEIISC